MSGGGPGRMPSRSVLAGPAGARTALILLALGFLVLFLFLPVLAVFVEAFRAGLGPYWDAITDEETLTALRLTLISVLIAVPLNAVFGLAAAWAIARFDFRGKSLLVTLIDLPFAVSPVIAGMLFVLLFGARGLLGPWLEAHHLKVIFATPGIALATTFVTFPFVAREVIPLLESRGPEEEQAALVLGASGLTTFLKVTLPNVRWALLYGVVLSAARAMGEFGAVSVVSGHIRGATNTVPLHVEVLYNEYRSSAAFSVASILVMVAFLSLVLKRLIMRKARTSESGAPRAAAETAKSEAPSTAVSVTEP
ncbi:Sulfate transport system permease protein CysW [Minicystis rosea]|nr:Sulfate transport system permease protein CysW [Minicystis rosea]